MTRWEYKEILVNYEIVTAPNFPILATLGEEGWELIATLQTEGGQTRKLIFKRPKQ